MDSLKRKMLSGSTRGLTPSLALRIASLQEQLFCRIKAEAANAEGGDILVSLSRPLKRQKLCDSTAGGALPRPVAASPSREFSTYTATLKYTQCHSTFSSSWDQRKRRVGFTETVQIQEIPSHRDYTIDVRTRIWTGLREIQANAERNEWEVQQEKHSGSRAKDEDQATALGTPLRRITKVMSFRDLARKGA